MLIRITTQHSRKIALLFFAIFYAELAGSLYASSLKNELMRQAREDSWMYRSRTSVLTGTGYVSPAATTSGMAIAGDGIRPGKSNAPGIASTVISRDMDKKDKAEFNGGGQPEMNSFKSAGVDNLVNLFTGDFSYNIPLLDLGGYPVNIFYSGGITMDQEASWVGLGWNLNPGTISRNMRGLPDDFNGKVDHVVNVQSIKPDRTIGVTSNKQIETAGQPRSLTGRYSLGIFYNNRRGLGLEAGITAEYSPQKMLSMLAKDEKTLNDTIPNVSLDIKGGITLNSQNGLTANVGLAVSMASENKKYLYGLGTNIGYNSRFGLTDLSIDAEKSRYRTKSNTTDKGVEFKKERVHLRNYHISSIDFARSSYTPSIRMPLTRESAIINVKLGTEKKSFFKNLTLGGYIQTTSISPLDTFQKKPAYGFMHHGEAANDENAIMDFNRMNDGTYTLKSPMISVPAYTYDVFTINGEGTGGTFRGYQGNVSFVKDNETRSRSGNFQLYIDLGGKSIFHGGTTLGGSYANSEVGEWRSGNQLRSNVLLKRSDRMHQGFYFKNPGEKAIIDEAFYNSLGKDQLIRPYLEKTKSPNPVLASGYRSLTPARQMDELLPVTPELARERDKRSQAISYFTAEEADLIGLDSLIYSYTENEFKPGSCVDPDYKVGFRRFSDDEQLYRKRHHISQVNVLESNGSRYVYGTPVYQTLQKEVSFSTNGTPSNRLITYGSGDNSVFNKTNDGYYKREELKGYAHSYLLTGILSPDYVDVTGNGITEDDLGTAVKFNYSRVGRKTAPSAQHPNGANYWHPFKWRMPVAQDVAIHNEGLKGDDRDDKGMYTYGEKEIWYLHSIESKNMVACFYTSERNDGRQVKGENGGVYSSPDRYRLKRLDSIRLFTKAEFLLNGDQGTSVKTVHFEYSYKLCESYPLNPGSPGKSGKLTLESIWFSYNNHSKTKKNKYVFRYGAIVGETINPLYSNSATDRWGNYKAEAVGKPNADFPYAEQDATLANKQATAWNLTDILLPSGGVMSVEYEADDYAYVQDRRASLMHTIAGFGRNPGSVPTNKLYTFHIAEKNLLRQNDHRFVFFDIPEPLSTTEEIATYYLQDFKQLLMKLWVKMPRGHRGMQTIHEPIMVYAGIKSYGFATSGGVPNYSRIYVEMEPTEQEGSPAVQTAFQFLREKLPHRAYPGYQVNGDGPLREVVRAVWGLFNSLVEGVASQELNFKSDGFCREVDLAKSGARLNAADFKKRGGGHRVKKVVIGDNWSKLLNRTSESAKLDSWYGQEYDYTTVEEVNGEMKVISSGVATYEPGVGNEENPFREILQFRTTQPLGPTSHDNVELPFGEMFFPATMVGYSRVTVRSIHNKTNKRLKAGVGLQQTNFYTNREFPVVMDYTNFDKESRSHHKPGLINKVFEFRMKDYITLTQGFRVVINDMHGKLKSQASFPENDYKNAVNFTSYHYRTVKKGDGKLRLDNYLPVIKGADGIITTQLIGKDVEVMNDFRQHSTIAQSAQIPLNADVFNFGNIPFLLPTVFRLAFKNENRYRSATTLKVVNEYGILDSVVNIDKGSVVGTRNLVYDAETGDVLLTRTTNEFKDPVYQFSYPAWWVHSGMEPAYKNLDMVYSGVLFRNGIIDNITEEMMANFESGDEVFVMYSDNEGPLESETCMRAGFLDRLTPGTEPLIWALDIRKDLRNEEKKFIFLDRNGVPYNARNATIRVVRSGKRNIGGASAGSFMSLENPVREVEEGKFQVVIDNLTGVVNAGAVEFRERWRANDQFYTVDNKIVTVRQTPLVNTTISAEQTYSVSRKYHFSDKYVISRAIIDPGQFAISKLRRKLNNSRRNFDQQSWMLLDLPPGMEGATVRKATLMLPPHHQHHPPIDAPEFWKDVFALGQHQKQFPHQTYKLSDHSSSTAIKVSRMITPWEDKTNEMYWLGIFDDTWANDLVNNHVRYMPFYTPSNAQFSQQYEVNIPHLMQGIINNYGNPDHPPALKLSFVHNSFGINDENSNTPWRFCFKTHDTEDIGDDFPPPNVRVNLTYYKCQETDPVVYTGDASGAPTDAPEGYVFCSQESIQKVCLSTFDKKQMNPYIQGILGNWRGYRSYVFYGERKEQDPLAQTNLRKDGQLKDFVNYWAFAGNPEDKLGKTGDERWVWNSEITQYNRKGAELENRDPLDRYNSGIYGYQESLPVAVVNNSQLRLSAFDGFEDYAYQDDPCQPYCEPTRRHFKTGVTTAMLSQTESHTGRHSLKINQNTSLEVDVPVSANDTEFNPDQLIEINRTEVTDVLNVTPLGIGLKGDYYDYSDFTNFKKTRTDRMIKLRVRQGVLTGDVLYLPSELTEQYNLSVRWTGSLQVTRKGDYDFDAVVDDDVVVSVKIDGVWETVLTKRINNNSPTRQKVHLLPGTLYEIKVEYVQKSSDGYIQLLWRQPDLNEQIPVDAPYVDIPMENMYPAGQESLADNSVETVTGYCEKPDDIQAVNHQFIDGFELVPGQKMVVSVWVKKGEEDCHCSSYNDLSIVVKDATGTMVEEGLLKPKENVIEGWQQMEAIFTVPESGEKISLAFTAPTDKALFVDDLRFHPYHANMKSFVYDPVTLRLVADLDENNFASFYEYDDEGTLIRVKKETRAGIKTITETRSAIQKQVITF